MLRWKGSNSQATPGAARLPAALPVLGWQSQQQAPDLFCVSLSWYHGGFAGQACAVTQPAEAAVRARKP